MYLPTFIKGIIYSNNVFNLATALDTTISYFFLCSSILAKSSALECIATIFFNSILFTTSFKKVILYSKNLLNSYLYFLELFFRGIPGKPAPVPISIIF